jgi:hypothetical protein
VNIAVDNADMIALRYGEIASALNKGFRTTDSKTANTLQVGSYGRWTAIKGISDLDMLYCMPIGKWANYNKTGGQYKLLRDTADTIQARYPTTTIRVDRLVVRVLYNDFHVEVQPVFGNEDGSFMYPDSYNGGSWKVTRPREELDAMASANDVKNRNLRRLCKMARAWKNKHGVAMGGLLIDTLAYRFLTGTNDYDNRSYNYYDFMVRDFFKFLSDLPNQEYFAALGSGQRVKVKKKFQKKAAKAHCLCLKAIMDENSNKRNESWRKVFGRGFPPPPEVVQKAHIVEGAWQARNTEEFIEDLFPVDIRYPIKIDCEVTQQGFRPARLRAMLSSRSSLFARKSLRFFVVEQEIPGQFILYWKVLNRGAEAVRKDCIRGQLIRDRGHIEKIETTSFRGDHVVECYAVMDGVVVATDRIHVPIEGMEEK